MRFGIGNLQDSPVPGHWTMGPDESQIPALEATGGQNGELVGLTGTITDEQRYGLALAAGFTGSEAINAVAISIAEDSNGDPSRRHENKDTNGNVTSTDLGLWQINSVHWARFNGEGALIDPLNNAKAAYAI